MFITDKKREKKLQQAEVEQTVEVLRLALSIPEKAKLKKGSIQLPVAMWDFMGKRAESDAVSVARTFRVIVTRGILSTILDEIDNITPQNIARAKEGYLNELKTILICKKIKEIKANEEDQYKYKMLHDFRENTKNETAIEYYQNNPDELEKAKEELKETFLSLSQNEFIRVIGGSIY